MPKADVEDYQRKLRDAIRQIFEKASSPEPEKRRAQEFLQTVAAIGAQALDAKCCSIFLRDGENETILKIRAASPGGMGDELMKAQVQYYVPAKRNLFKSKKERDEKTRDYLEIYNTPEDKLENCLRQLAANDPDKYDEYRVFWESNSSKDSRIRKRDLINRLIDDRKLPMGITAASILYLEDTPMRLCWRLAGVRDDPEWRGSYEEIQGEICTSLIIVKLKLDGRVNGLIKIENHTANRSFGPGEFDALQAGDAEKEIWYFGEQHKQMLEILADCVVHALAKITEQETSYRSLAGSALLDMVAGLGERKVLGKANPQVSQFLAEFCRDEKNWDLRGVDTIYGSVADCIKKVMETLGLDQKYGKLIKSLQSSEALLRLDTRYRDHFIHQFQVFLLGYCIINMQPTVRQTLLTYLREVGVGREEDGEALMDDVIRCWLLASLFHDVAYSLELYRVWLGEHFRQLFPPRPDELVAIPWGNLLGIHEAALEYYKTRICRLICERIGSGEREIEHEEAVVTELTQAMINRQDHGVLGALVLRHCYGLGDRTGDLKCEHILVEQAAVAIALHTSPVYRHLYQRMDALLSPESLPFAFLLVFCDSAQDWGRPLVAKLHKGAQSRLEEIQSRIALLSIQIDDNGVSIKLQHPSIKPRPTTTDKPDDAWEQSKKMPCAYYRYLTGSKRAFEKCWPRD